jgi:hypothetical protein
MCAAFPRERIQDPAQILLVLVGNTLAKRLSRIHAARIVATRLAGLALVGFGIRLARRRDSKRAFDHGPCTSGKWPPTCRPDRGQRFSYGPI